MGDTNWEKNIYQKVYKKVYKNLVFSIYKNNVYIADNIGFIYAINSDNGEIIWIKNVFMINDIYFRMINI